MNKTREAVQDYLPESIQYLMTIISVDSVFLLVKNYGGTGVDIPSEAKPDHFLAVLIGMVDFEKLAFVFASTRLEIPACSRFISLMRAFSILQERRGGASNRTLALKYGISQRCVNKASKKAKEAEQTMSFDDMVLKFRPLFTDSV